MNTKKIGAIIPAGGKGIRMGVDVPKQYLKIKDIPIIIKTIELISSFDFISEIILVCPQGHIIYLEEIIKEYNVSNRIKCVVEGGERRQDSVRNGFLKLSPSIEYVLIHDAVRPFAGKENIVTLIAALDKNDAVILGRPLTSTIKLVDEKHKVVKTLDRNFVYEIQTPQVFKKEILNICYRDEDFNKIEYTDESMMVELQGCSVSVVLGNADNIKITTPFDLKIIEGMA